MVNECDFFSYTYRGLVEPCPSGGGGGGIYDGSGTLSGDTVVDADSNDLSFTNLATFEVNGVDLLEEATKTIFQQVTGQTTDTITVTANSGRLPATDANILLLSPAGLMVQGGAGANGYTINRNAPAADTITLNNTPVGATNYALILAMPIDEIQ